MKAAQALVLGFGAVAFAAPTSSAGALELETLFSRAVGDSCTAPEGTGSCQSTAKCNGISYPTNLCPKDPNNVQCCVEIKCSPPSGGSGFCRSVANNGCSGGTFVSDLCPGSSDIKCCVKAATNPPSTTPSTPKPNTNSWPACQKTLSCTFAQIAAVSMSERLAFVRYMQSTHFGALKAQDQFRAIEGVILFFDSNGLGAPESWVSYVDAGIVEGIERGGAIALGLSTDDGGNKGSAIWASFFRRKRDGQLDDRTTHDKAWSEGEQAATEYGVERADAKFSRSARERNWFWTTQLFRLIMRNRTWAINILRVPLLWNADNFVDWLTDIRDTKPAQCMSEVGWFFAGQLDGVPGTEDVKEILGIVDKLKKCFEERKSGGGSW